MSLKFCSPLSAKEKELEVCFFASPSHNSHKTQNSKRCEIELRGMLILRDHNAIPPLTATEIMTGTSPAYWRDPEATKVQAVCLGTGRFLRSVLVPPLTLSSSLGLSTIVIQPRGRSFIDYVAETKGSYEVDTVTESGATQTDQVKISGAFTLQEKAAMYKEFDELDFSRYASKSYFFLSSGRRNYISHL